MPTQDRLHAWSALGSGGTPVLFLGWVALRAGASPDQELLVVSLLWALADFGFDMNCILLRMAFFLIMLVGA